MNNELKLYLINKDIEMLLGINTSEETGEISDEAFEQIEKLELEKEDLIHNVGLVHNQAKANKTAVDEEIKRLQSIKKTFTSRETQAKKFLTKFCDGAKYEFDNLKISWRKSEAVEIDDFMDVDEFPEAFIKVEKSLMKAEIKKELKAGKEINGAKLVTNQNIQIK